MSVYTYISKCTKFCVLCCLFHFVIIVSTVFYEAKSCYHLNVITTVFYNAKSYGKSIDACVVGLNLNEHSLNPADISPSVTEDQQMDGFRQRSVARSEPTSKPTGTMISQCNIVVDCVYSYVPTCRASARLISPWIWW
jgi:hypothetical protein